MGLAKEFGIGKYHASLLEDRMSNIELNCIRLMIKNCLVKSVEVELTDIPPKIQREEFVIRSIENKIVYKKILIERKV